MCVNALKYKENILHAYDQYDKILENVSNKYGRNSHIFFMLESARLRFVTGQNIQRGFFFDIIMILKSLASCLFKRYYLTSLNHKIVILSCLNFKEDKAVSSLTKLPLSYLKHKKKLNTNRILVVLSLFQLLFIIYANRNTIQTRKYLYFVPKMIHALSVYLDIEFGSVESIITAIDGDSACYAVIMKANESVIKTMKIDHFLINNVVHNKIYCKSYYCPNDYCLGLLSRFNPSTNFIIGGYPRFDTMQNYEKQGNNDRKNYKRITYFTQHSYLSGEQLSYIRDLIDIIGNDGSYNLVIKVHKHDNNDYSQYISSNVSVLKGFQIDNYQLIADSDYTFSISSTLSLEAKHICKNSYLIHYSSAYDYGVIDYNYFEQVIDIVTSKVMLIEILKGHYKPRDIKHFIENFNPSYPYTCLKLLKHIKKKL